MACKVILRLAGVVLLVAAVLKAHAFLLRGESAYAASFQAALIFGELLVGEALVFGKQLQLNWILACLLFGGFAAMNTVKGLEGETSCGCMGVIRTSPWPVALADTALLLLLLWKRPTMDGPRLLLQEVSGLMIKIGGGIGLFAVVLFALVAIFGSEERAIAHLRGSPYSVTPEVLDFGTGEPGQIKTVRIAVRNWSPEPLQVVGGSSACSFRSVSDLPLTVVAGGTASLRVSIRFPAQVGRFTETKQLLYQWVLALLLCRRAGFLTFGARRLPSITPPWA